MDDSDQDFVELCSKPLKRVRKKPSESSQPRKAQHQTCSQTSDRDKRRRNNKKDTGSASQPVSAGAEQHVDSGGTGHDSGDAGSSVVPSAVTGPRSDRGQRAKDKVLFRMQQFRRASPQKMVHADKSQPTSQNCAPFAVQQREGTPESFSSDFHPKPPDSDEALALRLQQELDREAAEAQTVDLEDGGLFFCQICNKDLSHMTPEGRTQHLNRCLDESEESAPAPPPPPPPPPSVPDCPICGKKFKSQKSRSAHLKRCSSDMGVSPAVLLQALQRQAEENKSTATANTHIQTVSTKRKGPSKPALPSRKKPRKKTEPMDEATMVALALSSSLLEQQKEQLREMEAERQLQPSIAASNSSMTPLLKWRTDAGKGRGKRKKGAIPRPPPLLLVQDAEAALTRLQERVSALLLRSRAPSPPTPTLCPSTLPGWSGAAPLWQKSTLLDRGSASVSDFYAPQLREFFTPQESVTADAASCSTTTKPESSVQPVAERTPLSGTRASILLSPSRTASCSPAPSTLVGSQVLRDLMELAEEGMTLSQCGYTARGNQINAGLSTNLRLSGFIQEESEEQVDLCASGFLPEKPNANLEETYSQVVRTTDQPRAVKETNSHQSVTLSRLASDLSSMVNNPQLSDVQLQVDSGEIYFAHSFMVYARCPLLAEMVHESGFGVQEEDMPAGKRVLINDVPGQAVFTLLQYLYTAHCSIPASLQPHMLELASRFDLQELQQLCQLHPEEAAALRDEADYANQEENYNNRTDEAILELLRSMWNGEDEDDDGADSDRQDEGRRLEEDRQADEVASGDREIREEQVNEEELEEIYEFAATQRKREETDSQEEEDEEERVDEEDGDAVFTKLTEHKTGFCEKNLQPNSKLEPDPGLDRSYNRLVSDSWGVYEEGDCSSVASTSALTKTTQSKQHKSPHKPSFELSGRILLQSSASLVDDLSFSPPHSASTMPTTGLSPGPVGDLGEGGDKGEDAVEQDVPLKRESQGPCSICIPPPTDSPQKKEEPELIVLSDSSEEMEVDVAVLSSQSPLPFSPCIQSYTEIKSKQIPLPNVPALENKESSSLELSPADPLACSPEVSWLIPSTPVHPGRNTTSSSTQTQSSMCRTQLFPKGDASPPSSSVFSSPALPSNSMLHTSNSPTKVSASVGPTEDSVSRLKLNRMIPSSSRLDLNVFPNKSNSSSVLLSKYTNSYSLKASLKQDTPLHLQPQLHSSTPLHTEHHQPPVLLAASPLHTDPDEQRSAPLESPETTELGSFHLSPLSDPSERPSSSSHSGLQNSKRHSKSSSQSQHSVESSSRDNAGVELTRREERNEKLGDSKDLGSEEQEDTKGETGGADGAESSFRQSFLDMDEPPIAFNDSWGLDACVDSSPGCCSLRLEDSGRSSKQEHGPGQQETASPPSNRSVQPLNNCDSVTPPSLPKGQQPSSSLQARTSPEFDKGLLDSKIWDSWEEEEEEEVLPLSQRLNPSAQLKTPVSTCNKRRRSLVPITPMPHYSDMDTPELKNKLNRFGVRPLPKRQMILKLKEIHQYTHQLVSSDSEDEAPPAGQTVQMKPPVSRPASSLKFKEPLTAISPVKHHREDEAEPLSASQGSNTSSTAASEESERSNPELCVSSDGESDSDAGISCSQAASRLQDRLKAVRSFILSDSQLYSQILQYQPLVLSQLQQQLKAAGIRLGAAKLVDYLDSQCITFTTAKPGHSAPSRRQGKRTDRGAKAGGRGASRKKVVAAMI